MAAKKDSARGITLWDAVRDLGLALINKGQGFGGLLLIIGLVIVARMPATDLGEVVKHVVFAKPFAYLGWPVAVVLAIGWVASGKRLRKMFAEEIKRIAKERNEAQKRAGLEGKARSSGRNGG